MDDPFVIYEGFNYLECLTWIGIAVALPFVVKCSSRRQRIVVLAASVGFVFFGFSDFWEARTHGQLPPWLWVYKIGCAAFILSCRFSFVGWHQFRFTDRYLLFGLFCLAASLGAIVLQYVLYGN